LKRVQKNWFHELKRASSHYYCENAWRQGKRPTHSGMGELKRICYATRSTTLEWKIDCWTRRYNAI